MTAFGQDDSSLPNASSGLDHRESVASDDLGERLDFALSAQSQIATRLETSAAEDIRSAHRRWRASLSICEDLGPLEPYDGEG